MLMHIWLQRTKKQEMFQEHLCSPWCKIQVYLLCRSKTCTKQVTKGLKYIKWTTHWAQKSSLTLTFEHVTWKSIEIIYSLRATPARSMVLIKWRGQKILTEQHTGLRRVAWPWPLIMWPENQYGSSTHWKQPLHQVWYWSSEGSKDIDRTRLGLHTDRHTDRLTDSCKIICPLFQRGGGGHKNQSMFFLVFIFLLFFFSMQIFNYIENYVN